MFFCMKNKRILILGSSGFIGRALVREMLSKNDGEILVPSSQELNLVEADAHHKIVAMNPDIIILAAGKSFVPDSWVDPRSFFEQNISSTVCVAEAARLLKAKVIYLSTFVYGPPYRLPISELNPVSPFNPYAASKLAGERVLQDYSTLFGVESNILRLFNVYGPGQRTDFLIPTLIQQVVKGEEIRVKDLLPKRDYVHLYDVISAIAAATHSFNGCRIYNVASGVSYSVSDLIQLLVDISGKKIPVYSEQVSRPNEVMDTMADIRKIHKDLGWSPVIEFKQGLTQLLG